MVNKKYDHEEIIAYYLSGHSQVETAVKFGTSNQYVYVILKDNKIPIRPVDRCGSKNPNWKGGVIDDGHGRKLIYCPEHPNPSMYGTHVYEYRLIMEKELGRFLKSEEAVHHINGDYSDNSINNLKVMSQSKHAKHHGEKNYKNNKNFLDVCNKLERDNTGRFKKSPTII